MSATVKPGAEASELELVITREFDAPRDLVYKAWTEPEHISQWWGPEGFSTRVEEYDFRVGGKWRYVMVGPDGTEYPALGVFTEIEAPEKIVASDGWDEADQEGKPAEMIVTTFFEEIEPNRTRLTIRILHATVEDLKKHLEMGVVLGWQSSLDCLENHLATLRDN